jgi:RNA polymerase-binding transcription factor DksA
MEEPPVRELLTAEREATLARIGSMSAEFDDVVEATAGANSDDEHDPEGSTIAFERARIAALLREAHASLRDLDDALERLGAGTYGVCDRCGSSIAAERLAARPATRTCIGCAAASLPGP